MLERAQQQRQTDVLLCQDDGRRRTDGAEQRQGRWREQAAVARPYVGQFQPEQAAGARPFVTAADTAADIRMKT